MKIYMQGNSNYACTYNIACVLFICDHFFQSETYKIRGWDQSRKHVSALRLVIHGIGSVDRQIEWNDNTKKEQNMKKEDVVFGR